MKFIKSLKTYPSLYYLPILLTTIIILYFSLIPTPFETVGIRDGLFNFDILHLLAYFALSLSMSLALSNSKDLFKKYNYLFSILFCFLFGVFIEITQYFIPGRFFTFIDTGINLIGISSAQLARFAFSKLFQN